MKAYLVAGAVAGIFAATTALAIQPGNTALGQDLTASPLAYASTVREWSAHLLDGLPDDLVVHRSDAGRVIAAKDSVAAGFVWQGGFVTREQAAGLLSG